ncbi:TPA: hypothetical protein DDW35_03960 [Candidatus Sumerlaeota bacterium]|nr:hypothetical protein [Candidatus Sumerlaeota bacterium]
MTPVLSIRTFVLRQPICIGALCYLVLFVVSQSIPQTLLAAFLAFSIPFISCFVGGFAAWEPSTILSKPLGYFLPDYRTSLRKSLAIQGIVQSALASLFVLLFPCDAFGKTGTHMLAVFLVSLAFFGAWVEGFLTPAKRGAMYGVVALFFLFLDLKLEVMKSLIFSYPICPIVVCPFFLRFFWNQLHGTVLTEKCRKEILASFSKKMSTPIPLENEEEERNLCDCRNGYLGQFLLKRVQQSIPQSASQAFWGSLYENLHFLSLRLFVFTMARYTTGLFVTICLFCVFLKFSIFTTSTTIAFVLWMCSIDIIVALYRRGNSSCVSLLLRIGRRNYSRYLLALWGGIYLVLLPVLLFSLVGFFLLIGYFAPSYDVSNVIANTWASIIILGPVCLWVKSFSLAYPNRLSSWLVQQMITIVFFGIPIFLFFQFKPLMLYFHSAGNLLPWGLGVAVIGVGGWILTLRRLIRRSDLL